MEGMETMTSDKNPLLDQIQAPADLRHLTLARNCSG